MDMPRCPVCEYSDEVWTVGNFVSAHGNTASMLGPEKMIEGLKTHLAELLMDEYVAEPKKPSVLKYTPGFAAVLFGADYYPAEKNRYEKKLAEWRTFKAVWEAAFICVRCERIFIPDVNAGEALEMDVVEFCKHLFAIRTGTL